MHTSELLKLLNSELLNSEQITMNDNNNNNTFIRLVHTLMKRRNKREYL